MNLFEIMEGGRNKAVLQVVAWAIKNPDKKTKALELSREIGVSRPCVREALKKLEGKLFQHEVVGSARIYWAQRGAIERALGESGLCFLKEGGADSGGSPKQPEPHPATEG